MGFSLSWIAVNTHDYEAVLSMAGVGRPPDGASLRPKQVVRGAQLESGWYLLLGEGCEHRLLSDEVLSPLSAEWDCIACSVEEHVMYSSASFWSRGELVWTVAHDAQLSWSHLDERGDLPSYYLTLRENLLTEQRREGGAAAEVDLVFEVPLRMAEQLTGFKHDEGPASLTSESLLRFTEFLHQHAGETRALWRRLFG